jgi:hypothetical protein
MLGHLGVNVSDLVAAKAYYDDLMPLLGFQTFFAADDEFCNRPAGRKPGTFVFFTRVPRRRNSRATGLGCSIWRALRRRSPAGSRNSD